MKQETRLLQYMEEHDGITAAEAFKYLGIMRLSARIFDLKQSGYKIVKIRITDVNRYGEKVRYDRYKVVEE